MTDISQTRAAGHLTENAVTSPDRAFFDSLNSEVSDNRNARTSVGCGTAPSRS